MKVYIYNWAYEIKNNRTIIRIFCLTQANETVCLIVDDFLPYFYIELPSEITINNTDTNGKFITNTEKIVWNKSNIEKLNNSLQTKLFKKNVPSKFELKNRKKLYYAHKTVDMKDLYFKYLVYYFNTDENFRKLRYKLNGHQNVSGIGRVPLKTHETDVSPILQLVCQQNLQMSGWIEFEEYVEYTDEEINCKYQYHVPCHNLRQSSDTCTPNPMVLSFDIEVYSPNPNKFPDPRDWASCIFQISCVYWRIGEEAVNYLLTIGDANPDLVKEDEQVITLCYPDEATLLVGFIKLMHKHNPHIITGWNILGFDINYMMERAQRLLLDKRFASCGMVKGKECEKIDDSWSSKAYGKQTFQYYDWDGRIVIDLLMFARREIKAENYKLDTIASQFVKAHKDPLTHKDIFRAYEYGVLRIDEFGEEGIRLLSECGKYCTKDSILVQRLFNEWDIWIGLTEMASICNVPSSFLYMKGQQIKVFSQVYKYCYDNKIVVENDVYKCKDNERCTGGEVKEPEPGLYDEVVVLDFASLYPSLIIAYNIDYSTFVIDEKILDELCHVIAWNEEHEYDVYDCVSCGSETRYMEIRTSDRKKTIPRDYCITVVCEHCEHNFSVDYAYIDKTKKGKQVRPTTRIFTDDYRYRFLKEPKGVLPTIAENLLLARASVREHIKELKKNIHSLSGEELSRTKNLINILNKRQLSYKVSVNSLYGALGVRRGMLPLMPGAMCTTAMGRFSFRKAGEYLEKTYNVNWVYGDTDSVMVQFLNIPKEQLWEYCRKVEQEMLDANIFPKPMKLELENIYNPLFMLRKKRYMFRYYKEDGTTSKEIGNKGVVLARRGTSKILKDIYEGVVNGIFNKKWDKETTLYYVLDFMNKCCSSALPIDDFIITKKINDIDSYASGRALPAHVRVAQTMRKRGSRVDVGQRLEYVVTTIGGLKGTVTDKAEDVIYQQRFSNIIPVDYMYYIHLISKQIDELLVVTFKLNDFMNSQYKLRIKKHMMMEELRFYHRPRIVYVDDETDSKNETIINAL